MNCCSVNFPLVRETKFSNGNPFILEVSIIKKNKFNNNLCI